MIIAVGKTSTDYVARGVEEFLKRANRYVGVELTVIPDVKSSKALTEDAQKQQEDGQYLPRCSRVTLSHFLMNAEKNSPHANFRV